MFALFLLVGFLGGYRGLGTAGAEEGYEGPTFDEVATASGLEGVSGSNLGWVDFDHDGYVDLVVNGHRLFRGSGPPEWSFAEVEEDGIDGGYGGVWGDFDNDGLIDVFVVTGNSDTEDRLYRNLGEGQFMDVTADAGLSDAYETPAAAWGDYDGDGYIDLYVANYENSDNMGEPRPDFLWHNNGDGTFSDVSEAAGIRDEPNQCGRGVNWGDFDNDGDLDIHVSNYRLDPNYLWENQGDGTFIEVGEERGVEGIARDDTTGGDAYGHTIGSAWADWDNDLDLDLFTANLVHKDHERGRYCDDSKLYRNNGPGSGYGFTDIREGSGIEYRPYPGDEDELFSGPAWADYDNDGDLDLFITQVYTNLDYAHSHFYMNLGGGKFANVVDEAGVKVWAAWGTAWADYDQDGDMDLVVGGRDGSDSDDNPARVHLFRNQGPVGHTFHITLAAPAEGSAADATPVNTAAIGVRVILRTDEGAAYMREVEGGMGTTTSFNSLELEFGLGEYDGSVELEVHWSNASVQRLPGLTADSWVILVRDGWPEVVGHFGDSATAPAEDEGSKTGYTLLIMGLIVIVGAFTVTMLQHGESSTDWSGALSVAGLMVGSLLIGAGFWIESHGGDDEDNKEDGYVGPPPYEAHADHSFDPDWGYADERTVTNLTYTVEGERVAGVTFWLDWEDEEEYDGGQYAYRNNGDSFALTVWGPDGSHIQSRYVYNEHEQPGHVEVTLAFPWDAPGQPGDYTVSVMAGECGDQRAFGGAYIREDGGNSYRLEGQTAVWVEA